jgi:ribulose-5-phosphate 4-epimerase/fuculose-1-phosphate aldolase
MAKTVMTMPPRMSTEEWQTRLDLAACYRLVDLFGWSDLVNTRITARVPGQHDQFLINPYGLLFDEITASSLVKIDAEGNKVEPSESEINSGGFAIPSTIHMARPEVACVLHTHSIAGCAVSMQRDGLLPLNQHALQIIGDIAYHDYEGAGRSAEERARLLADLNDRHILVLRNHGLLIVGRSIAGAFIATYRMERACAMQLAFQQSGAAFHPITDEVVSAASAGADQIALKLCQPAEHGQHQAAVRRCRIGPCVAERAKPGFLLLGDRRKGNRCRNRIRTAPARSSGAGE